MSDPASTATPDASASEGAADVEGLSFEVALERLEGIVDRLEEGDLELEAALAAFEEGVALSRRCAEHLEGAERRIELLLRDGDSLTTDRFEAEDAEPEESE
jgi:exodeoxyribonuclease VII small subunit